jgi:hypothetical protein
LGWPRGDECDAAFLLGVLSSLPLDWYARRFVEVNVNFFIVNPFPVPRPKRDNPLWQRAVALAARLAARDDRYADWAAAVRAALRDAGDGENAKLAQCGPLKYEQCYDFMCELDAVVAHLYGLEEKHLRHIFETFHEGWSPGQTASHPTLGDYDLRLKTTLGHYRARQRTGRQ